MRFRDITQLAEIKPKVGQATALAETFLEKIHVAMVFTLELVKIFWKSFQKALRNKGILKDTL